MRMKFYMFLFSVLTRIMSRLTTKCVGLDVVMIPVPLRYVRELVDLEPIVQKNYKEAGLTKLQAESWSSTVVLDHGIQSVCSSLHNNGVDYRGMS